MDAERARGLSLDNPPSELEVVLDAILEKTKLGEFALNTQLTETLVEHLRSRGFGVQWVNDKKHNYRIYW